MKVGIIYRYFFAILLFAAFFAQTFDRAFIVLDYYTHVSEYAKNCENKDKPEMHCNGKCQMMKKLKEEDKQDHQNPERKSENKNETVLSANSFYSISLVRFFIEKNHQKIIPFSEGKVTDRSYGIFHPPQAC